MTISKLAYNILFYYRKDDLDYCKLDGEFAVGNYFSLKPKGAPAVKVYITELLENNDEKYKRFTDCTNFFGAKMYDIHELNDLISNLDNVA